VIIPVSRAVVHEGLQAEFERVFLEDAVARLRRMRGMIGLSVGRPLGASSCELLMVTHRADLGALREFAGEDWSRAVIDLAEAHLLMETHVYHHGHAAAQQAAGALDRGRYPKRRCG